MITDPFSTREQARTSLNTGSIFRYLNGCDTHSGSNWDPMAQDGTLEGSMACLNKFTDSLHPALMDNQETGSCSILKRQSDLNHVDLVTNQQCLGQINASEFRHNYTLHMTDSKRTQLNTAQYQDICNSDTEEMEASPDAKKRKRTPETDSPHIVKKNAEVGKQKDLMQLCSEVAKEQEEHKQTSKQNPRPNMCGKQTEGQTTETPHSGEAPKGNYIHVRARKGQATNSHSLAERVRREKISERMKFLQELVPGCNKITGKAVMLDEIINYVQSLQQQVEFLSMKLATVNPELNVDIERILSKEIFHTQSGSSAFQGLGPLLAPTNPYQLEHFHGSLQRIPDMIPQFTPLAQGAVLNDFNSLLQMGFYSNAASNNFEPNGG